MKTDHSKEDDEDISPTQYMKFKEWLNSIPAEFPEVFDSENTYQNPFIRDQQEYTYQAVCNGLKFLEEIALPWSTTDSFSLGQDATWGYIRILQCLSGAMEFEAKHRDKGGFEVSDDELND